MGQEVTLTGEQGRLAIDVASYENPSATNRDDANWLASTISVKAEPFSGVLNAAFTTHDLINLYEQLKKALARLSGTVAFQSTDGDLSLTIEFNKRGAATISGLIQPHGSHGASVLQFRLDTDQSALSQTLRQLELAVRRFPVKQMQ
jgi:hypothetical protein